MRFANQVVVITGGGRGIGYALAKAFKSEGAAVVVAEIDVERGQAAAQELAAYYQFIDVSDHDSVRSAVEKIASEQGQIDVWINNAGVAHKAPVVDLEIAGLGSGYWRHAPWQLLLFEIRRPSHDRARSWLYS